MAIITLKVRLRRIEGRTPVEESEIAARLAEMVEDLGEFEVDDTEGETATYEVTNVTLLVEQLEFGAVEYPPLSQCRWCSTPLQQVLGGRPAEFCSDAHRQAEYRHRHNMA